MARLKLASATFGMSVFPLGVFAEEPRIANRQSGGRHLDAVDPKEDRRTGGHERQFLDRGLPARDHGVDVLFLVTNDHVDYWEVDDLVLMTGRCCERARGIRRFYGLH